jgi:aryl sulfotransferase
MPSDAPKVTRVYQNHHLDSTRWEVVVPRDDDIIVTTSYKSGTTWTQQILQWMIYADVEPTPDVRTLSPWPDARFLGISREQLEANCEAVDRQRFLKSHLPLDGLPYWPQVKYLIVGRDPRDVFMSFYNHYWNYTDTAMTLLNETPDRVGDPLPPCPEDPRELWRGWISRGWFPWESEGYPFWSNLHHTATYWEYRHLPNFMFIHYGDMLADLPGAVSRIADFANIDLTPEHHARVVEETTFANVKTRAADADKKSGEGKVFWKGGSEAFFFKGTNGRWRDILTDEDLALYEQAKKRVLTDDCAVWLEEGGSV